MTMVKDGGIFTQTVRSDASDYPTAVERSFEPEWTKWTKFDFEMLQEACPSESRQSLQFAPLSDWTAELDAESAAIHADLFEASQRAVPED
jgi:hypothetical protein